MKHTTVFTVIALTMVAGLAAACSSGSNTAPAANSAANQTRPAGNTAAPGNTSAKSEEETPAAVKAAFPDAQSFTKQHKDIPKDEIPEIEKESGGKLPDTDHHSYLAFSTTGGARKQIGAATEVKAAGKDLVVVYENKGGSPFIKEVRADGVSPEFLKQFAGKGHDDKFQVGGDLKAAGGVDEATAKAIAQAVHIDILTMQTLYGAEHAH